MSYCEDCGTKLDNGLCPNCDEEAVIMERFDEYEDYGRSFYETALQQFKKRKERE